MPHVHPHADQNPLDPAAAHARLGEQAGRLAAVEEQVVRPLEPHAGARPLPARPRTHGRPGSRGERAGPGERDTDGVDQRDPGRGGREPGLGGRQAGPEHHREEQRAPRRRGPRPVQAPPARRLDVGDDRRTLAGAPRGQLGGPQHRAGRDGRHLERLEERGQRPADPVAVPAGPGVAVAAGPVAGARPGRPARHAAHGILCGILSIRSDRSATLRPGRPLHTMTSGSASAGTGPAGRLSWPH